MRKKINSLPAIKHKKTLLLRHDVDADLNKAVAMAQMEAKAGIKSTYFLMLRSPIYNLFSRENSKFVFKLIELGHEIGLHFDANFSHPKFDTEPLLFQEKETIERMFNIQIKAVSLHQPTESSIKALQDISITNTYSQTHLNSFFYISDSNMKPKESIVNLIASGIKDRLQVLIHPMWWMKNDKALTSEQTWSNILIDAFEQKQRQLLETERAYGTKRIFQVTEK